LAQHESGSQIAEAIWLAGDSSLYERFLGYWQMIVDGQSTLLAAQSHTYSNLHDHLAWLFPDLDAERAATDMLMHLDTGMLQTRQPAKLRLVLSAIDDCHIPFINKLLNMQERQELDLRIVLPEHPRTTRGVIHALQGLPPGHLRYFWEMADSTSSPDHQRLASNFMVVDGPYPLKEDALSESRRLCFFFGNGWSIPALKHNWGIWLRVLDRSMAADLERHFDHIWDLSSDTLRAFPPMITEVYDCN
jgi:hypothetical protein